MTVLLPPVIQRLQSCWKRLSFAPCSKHWSARGLSIVLEHNANTWHELTRWSALVITDSWKNPNDHDDCFGRMMNDWWMIQMNARSIFSCTKDRLFVYHFVIRGYNFCFIRKHTLVYKENNGKYVVPQPSQICSSWLQNAGHSSLYPHKMEVYCAYELNWKNIEMICDRNVEYIQQNNW